MGIPEALIEAGLPPLARAAWVEISLDAIATNVKSLKARLPEGGHLDVVLKANAYGLGAVQIARAALAAGARAVLVATFDEALQLRRAGIDAAGLRKHPELLLQLFPDLPREIVTPLNKVELVK